jgi:hypothetical protein
MCSSIGPLASQPVPPRRFRPAERDLPPSPPAEVLAEVAAAYERAEDLHAQDRELHFSHDEATGRLVIELRRLGGDVLEGLAPSRALEIMTGGAY